MRSRGARRIEDLRLAVGCLPARTQAAMLDGIGHGTIIVGAYTDRSGGVCPMLAAHRRGGRTDLIAFARAWDRFTGAGKRSRPATEHELAVLRGLLEAALAAGDGAAGGLGAAVAEHQRSARARRAAEAEPLDLPVARAPAPRALV
jgi:hypothetical protein